MLSLILFLTTVVGVNWAFYRSLFGEADFLPESLNTRTKISTHDASS
jgi:hypothetical protein